MNALAARLDALDTSLFARIRSQSNDDDKRSWLAVQSAVRRIKGPFTYLEIGSYLGGSIQPYLMDPLCRRIYSIDRRPVEQPDDRGQTFSYRDSSTNLMLENLRAIDAEQVAKVICFDSDACDVPKTAIAEPPDICLIDGEHTAAAVISDFRFCLSVCAADAVICFHDANVIHRAIGQIVADLTRERRVFTALKLGGLTFAIGCGECPALSDPAVASLSAPGDAYLRRMRVRQRRELVIGAVRRVVAPLRRGRRGSSGPLRT
jgi:hypothetical protein